MSIKIHLYSATLAVREHKLKAGFSSAEGERSGLNCFLVGTKD
jgi:hypothetical protein